MIQLKNKKRLILASLLILLGVAFRTVWHFWPNVEFITAATLLAGAYLGKKWAVIVPFLAMFLSDLILGNTNIFLFTWSAYIVIGYLSNLSHSDGIGKIVKATGLGIAASFWFYLWTNFGVWLLDSWGMYPKTISGLINCYILALPFLKYNLLGNIIFVPLSFTVVELYRSVKWFSLFHWKVLKTRKMH